MGGKCSNKCGGGTRTRKRKMVAPSKNGGKCEVLAQTGKCNQKPCPQNCVTSPWGAYGRCSKPCGGGIKKRHKHVLEKPENGGKKCGKLVQSSKCNTKKCNKATMDKWNSEASKAQRACLDAKNKAASAKANVSASAA